VAAVFGKLDVLRVAGFENKTHGFDGLGSEQIAARGV
jgi:hypothetical protein